MISANHITFSDPSTPSSWSSVLYSVLKHPPYSLAPQASNHTQLRHCSGDVWKNLISMSIYHDLASISTTGATTAAGTIRRRFVRLEHIGLSGVILYEIRMCSPFCLLQGDSVDVENCLTMRAVFGNPDSLELATDQSMNLDDLLDAVDAKVVHFPGYACTSFIVGQVMYAYLTNEPQLAPVPAPTGFSISCSEHPRDIRAGGSSTQESGQNVCVPIQHVPSIFELGDLRDTFSLSEDNAYLSLCIRTSSLENSSIKLKDDASKYSNFEEETEDFGDCSIDSLGPWTPPRLSYGLISTDKQYMASKDSLVLASEGGLYFSRQNESASFIDFTESIFEDIDLAGGNLDRVD